MMDLLLECSVGHESLRRVVADEATSVRVHFRAAKCGAGWMVTGILETLILASRITDVLSRIEKSAKVIWRTER